MTASHIQVFRTGPVKPIGLPTRTTTTPTDTMGVTNARDFHRRILSNNNNQSINNNSLNILSAKRCLFGSPAPGEIQNLYKEDMRRNREHFIQRYNYDILNEKFVDDNENDTIKNINISDNNNMDKCNNINEILIENRLHDDSDTNSCCSTTSSSSSSSSSSISTESSPNSVACENDCDKKCNLMNNVQHLSIAKDNNNIIKSTINKSRVTVPSSITSAGTLTSPTLRDKKICERQKPYSRQILITEYYSSRKTKLTQEIEVNQLPKPQKAKLHDQKRTQNCENV